MNPIQWFPGHMAKARRQVEEKLGLVDVVFELLDARAVRASQNPELARIIKDKPRLVVLNKADLADPAENRRWVDFFRSQGIVAVAANALTDDLEAAITPLVAEVTATLREKAKTRGMKERPARVMILGIPNVGKSQFINRLAGRAKTKTGDKPGVTKIQQVLKVGDAFELLDNPGILWPKFEDQDVAFKLALIGSIKDDLLPLDEVMMFGLNLLSKRYPARLKERYSLTELPDEPHALIEAIGKSRGALLKGGEVDVDRVVKFVIADIRESKFGRISFDKAP
jgi:ribosome biogenesis GTPase A